MLNTLKIFIFLLLIFFTSCSGGKKTAVVKGDLYFSDWRIGNFYHIPDSIVKRVQHTIDTMPAERFLHGKDSLFLLQYSKLKKAGLLYSPFIEIRTNKNSFSKLYLDSLEYNKIKIHKRIPLLEAHKKVKIKARAEKIDGILYRCIELKKVKLVKGQTYQKSRGKFKIEDYE